MFEVKYKKLLNSAILCSALFLSNESFAARGDDAKGAQEKQDSKKTIGVAPKFSKKEDVNSQSSNGKNKETKVSISSLSEFSDSTSSSMSKNLKDLLHYNENGRLY